ncbi:MAG: hypothetical protein K8S00_12355 [Bacteroidales bacterium]|nr:hypothetical protein [Bacteroidales bacterium]
MQHRSVKYVLFISISTAIILGITFLITGYINNEGFNPSNDGVILAQSYRIINGEIPHTDFISIAPVFSGILHSIHFYSPFPLVVSGRIFVLIEYYIYSVLWVYLLMIIFLKGSRKDYFHIFLPLIIAAFLLNLNTYHLYPWTSIDGILFSMLGIFFYFKAKNLAKNPWKYFLFIIALICVSLGSLAKQSFIFTALFIYIVIILEFIKEKKMRVLPLVIIMGASPLIAYLTFLLINNNLSDFIQQITGRTEFFKTTIRMYVITFVNSKLIVLYAFSIFILIFDFYSRRRNIINQKGWRAFLTFNNNKLLKYYISFITLITIFLSYWFILHDNYHSLPFEFFWIMLMVLFISLYRRALSNKQLLVCVSGLILAWSASISHEANTPVYTSGILVTCIIILIYNLLKQIGVFPLGLKFRLFLYVSVLVIMHGFFFAANYGQSKYNYRELSSKYLSKNVKDVLPEFGDIKTNPNTYNYYADFINIFQKLNMKDKFVLLPNNAIIYPVLDSRNPFPIDWMQGAEFVDSEEKLLEMISRVIVIKNIYLLIDRFDSKEMAFGFKIKNYDELNYPYMKVIKNKCTKIHFNSKYFDIYKSKSDEK